MKGFSRRNLFYMKKWYLFYHKEFARVQQLVAQNSSTPQVSVQIQNLIRQIPWGHNILIITKIKDIEEAFFFNKPFK